MVKLIEITLRSDLCAAVGKNYAAKIDLDTAIDEFGIPYIPSRRMKGCMREIAEYIELDSVDELFGKSAQSFTNSIKISNGRIKDYEKIVTQLKNTHFNANEVTDLFCSTRAQTAIDEQTGTAKDSSLRFMRVVNRTAPGSEENLKFYSTIEYDERFENDLQKVVSGLRNIGYKRNRGFGAVSCKLLDIANNTFLSAADFKDDEQYDIDYTVFLESDVILPDTDSTHTLDCIPGTSVLGAFAANYIKKYGDADFNNVFLNNDIYFGNLYVAKFNEETKKTVKYVPAYRFLAKIKSATQSQKGIHNIIGVDMNNTSVQYKPLKDGYINAKTGYLKPETKIIYHNTINAEKGGLYVQRCICSGQYFSGTISGSGEKLKKIYPLFESGALHFGRSKSAQYSRCAIKNISVKKSENKTVFLTPGTVAAAVLESDLVLCDENGVFTTKTDDFLSALGLDKEKIEIMPASSLATKTISGYNAKWNQKKPHFPVLKAGSCVVFKSKAELDFKELMYIGENLNEGFGKVRIINNADRIKIEQNTVPSYNESTSWLLEEAKKSERMNKVLGKAINNAKNLRLNSSQIGRIMLMCKESKDYDDFINRITSIKTKSVKDVATKFFKKEDLERTISKDWNEQRYYIIKVLTVRKYLMKAGEK